MGDQPSYTKINYSLRPAKSIERKMVVEGLRRLDRLSGLNLYRYVGFGSPYFADFSLVHKALGIRDMVSIERHVTDEERFKFNVPFATVELRFGEATEILPELDWEQRTIVWLDYDGALQEENLQDIALLISKLAPGSVLLLTVNAEPGDLAGRARRLRKRLGEYVPRDVTDERLGDWGLASVLWRVIDEQIGRTLADRNVGRSRASALRYRQLFHFWYRDGARMLTVGGLLHDEGQTAFVESCAFKDFEFYRPGADAYYIPVPKLTMKEMRHLDAQLPAEEIETLDTVSIPSDAVLEYAQVYRYFPRFVEADL